MTQNTSEKHIGFREDPGAGQSLSLWFNDTIEFAHGCRISVRIKDVLCHYRSRFQEIAVFETERLGRMLALDNITMLTEFDEAAYHEMIAHVPLLTHPKPVTVLVIGGGDGGSIREVLKHPSVEEVHLCELDEEVVKACRAHIPSLASAFDDPRVKVFYEDGAQFVKERSSVYDVIIVDSTDPIGPGQVLFQRPFYADMYTALKEDGMVVTQCESIHLHREVIRGVADFAKEIYPRIAYYYTLVPTYPSGVIGFMCCSRRYDPLKDFDEKRADVLEDLRYYTPELHRAAFVLPRFAHGLV